MSSGISKGITGTARAAPARLSIAVVGMSPGLFLVTGFVLCILLGLVPPNCGLHQPWLQFPPGFTWLTWPSFFLGLIESFAYGWYVAPGLRADLQLLCGAIGLMGACRAGTP